MNLYIELEVYNREIEAKMLLALEAVKRGYNVIIAHRSIIQKLALQNELPPGIIHMKDANSIKYQIEILKKLKKKKFYFTAQDEESGLLNKKYDTFAKIRFNNYKSFNFLNYFFCWGKRDYNYLKKKTKSAILTGSPRFDLFQSKKKIKIKNNKKILIVSSFNVTGVRSFADRIFSTTSQRDKHYEIAEKFAYDVESIHALKVYHFVKLTKFLSKTFKNYDICLRPHYHDKYYDWKKLINSNAKNITIEKIENNPLYKSILSSNFVIQNGCTSAIESLLLDVPCISYMPQEWKEDEHAKFPNSLGIKATNYNQVKKIIQSGNNKKNDIKIKILKERFFFEKNYYAYEKQVNIFDKIYQNFDKFEPSLYFKVKFILKKIIKKLTNKIYKKEKSPFEQKFPEFNEKKIKEIIKEIAANTHKNDYLDTKFNIISERLLFLKK